jgi:hypothetical protein
MRLSELVSHLTPTTFTVIGLVLFVAVFTGVVIRAYWPGTGPAHERARHLPLEGDRS